MSDDRRQAAGAPELRRLAESRATARKDAGVASLEDAQRLLHELEVHQIELEIQNEELREARREIEVGLARYRALFEEAPIGYATLRADGVVRELNRAGGRLLSRRRHRLVGEPFIDAVAPAYRDIFYALLQRAHYGEEPRSAEVELLPFSPGGASMAVLVSAAPLEDSDGVVLVAFEDVTERRTRERKLRETEQALREADVRKDEFLAALSHELRNPLAPIRSSLYVLGRAEPGSDKAKKAQEIIDRQVTHLTRLVDDLLDVTRIARGKVQLRLVRVDLGELTRRTMEDHRASFETNGVRLASEIDSGTFPVSADPARLVQILSNLLGNAEKFTPSGGCVTVHLARMGRTAELRVADTGMGIEPELLRHLFEPFAQAPQTIERSRGGLGLGLAMVKGLVELHGGRVTIASDGPGRGTEVQVALPLDGGEVSHAAAAESPPERRRRVLVIEDNADSADSLKEVLALGGHEVEIALDGPRGISRARRSRPDVVICDIGLPGMNGYAVARAFRTDEALRGTYLIALSGYARPENLQLAIAAGFDQHVAKPVDPRMLERLITEAPIGE